MFRLIFPTLTIIIVLFTTYSCKKVERFTQFSMTIEEELELPSVIGINLPIAIPTMEIQTDVTQQLEINNKKKKHIERVFLEALEVAIVAPANQDFNFLKSIRIFISALNLPEIVIAQEADLKNQSTQNLFIHPVEKLDLAAYIKEDKIDLRVEIITDETLFKQLTIAIKSTFWVDAKVFAD